MLWTDIRYGLRQLSRNPGFTSVVVFILALGIGANTAIFSAVSSVMLAPLPFAESERMARAVNVVIFNGQAYQSGVGPLYFDQMRKRSQLIEAAAAQRYQNLTLTGEGDSERVVGIGVSDQWMATMGVKPLIGRGFDATEETAGSDASVILITYGLWQRKYGGQPDVLGKTIRLNLRSYTIIGVMPRAFNFPYNTDLWMPMTFSKDIVSPGDLNVPVRLKPGVMQEAFKAEIETIGDAISREYTGAENRTMTARPYSEEFQRDPNNSITVLLAAVGFVLLLASVNVANLLLARSSSRTREVAIRTAMGATRGRQVRQLLVESMLLAGVAGAVGVGLAYAASEWLTVLIPSRLGEVVQAVVIDGKVLLATLLVTMVTAVLFGLMPAIRLSKTSPVEAIKTGGKFGNVRDSAIFRALVVAEVALAFILLVGAGLMAQNFVHLLNADIGYDPQELYKVSIGLPQPVYDDPERRGVVTTRLVEEVVAIPGITKAGITSLHPIPRTTSNTGTQVVFDNADPDSDPPVVNLRMVTPGYFAAVGMPVFRGRGINQDDIATSPRIVVVSEALANRYWPGEDPIGRRLIPRYSGDPASDWHTVVGVVPNIAEPDADDPQETLYRAYVQGTYSQRAGTWTTTSMDLLFRTQGETGTVLQQIRSVINRIDPNVTLFDATSMRAALAEPLSDQRMGAWLFVAFAAFGLLMAMLGTYGVIALSVASRIPEFGIRLTLGLQPHGLLRMVLGYGMGLVGAGLIVGATAAYVLSGLLQGVVSEISPHDPLTFFVVGAALLLAGIVASWIPARRAMKVDPMTALRYE